MEKKIKKVAVVGASGFIGGRLCERLFLKYSIDTICLIRNLRKSARLARFPFEIIEVDLLDDRIVELNLHDCDIMVFCAHGKSKNENENWRVNVEGLKKILKVVERNNIKQFVFMSTTAVYEKIGENGYIGEEKNIRCDGKDYASGKREGELICLDFSRRTGIHSTVLRPSIVYGPFAPSFTIYPVKIAKSGALKDYGIFEGYCNPVYIDDVIDAIVTTFMNKKAYNEIFNISGGEVITWREYFNKYNEIVRGERMKISSKTLYRIKVIPLRTVKEIMKITLKVAPNICKYVYQKMIEKGTGDWSWTKGEDTSSIREINYRHKQIYKIEKMRKILGYSPKYNMRDGMEITEEWLRHYDYIS